MSRLAVSTIETKDLKTTTHLRKFAKAWDVHSTVSTTPEKPRPLLLKPTDDFNRQVAPPPAREERVSLEANRRLKRLKGFRKTTNLSSIRLKKACAALLEGIKAHKIDTLLQGRVKTVERGVLARVFAAYRHAEPRVKITATLLRTLERQLKTKGACARTLLQHCANIPEGLEGYIIDSWRQRNAKTAKKKHWDYVMAVLDALKGTEPHLRRTMTKKDVTLLKNLMKAQGLGPKEFLKNFPNAPEDLTADMIQNLGKGTHSMLNKHWNFMIRSLQSTPSLSPPLKTVESPLEIEVVTPTAPVMEVA